MKREDGMFSHCSPARENFRAGEENGRRRRCVNPSQGELAGPIQLLIVFFNQPARSPRREPDGPQRRRSFFSFL